LTFCQFSLDDIETEVVEVVALCPFFIFSVPYLKPLVFEPLECKRLGKDSKTPQTASKIYWKRDSGGHLSKMSAEKKDKHFGGMVQLACSLAMKLQLLALASKPHKYCVLV
jgi:hypothetical protein